MRISFHQIVPLLLIFIVAATSSAQQSPTLSKRESAVKLKVDHLLPQAPISVLRFHADEEFGRFVSNDQVGLTFYDVDRKADVTLTYAEVKKIKDGYGGYNSVARGDTRTGPEVSSFWLQRWLRLEF